MNRFLIDTHSLLWWLNDDERLGPAARLAIATPTNTLFVSAATLWEIEIKRATGKLKVITNLAEAIDAEGFLPLPVDFRHATLAGRLPKHHNDPFDRMLVAQAQIEGLQLIAKDAELPRYGIPTLAANK